MEDREQSDHRGTAKPERAFRTPFPFLIYSGPLGAFDNL